VSEVRHPARLTVRREEIEEEEEERKEGEEEDGVESGRGLARLG
jgi:hypothetical protein